MDREAGIFADQANVHRIERVGGSSSRAARSIRHHPSGQRADVLIHVKGRGRSRSSRSGASRYSDTITPFDFLARSSASPWPCSAWITLGGREVREDVLMDTLWPDAEGDAARVALTSALHRLRGLLDCDGAVVRQEGQLSLDDRFCWVDVWAVERVLGRAEAAADGKEDVRKAVGLFRRVSIGGEAPERLQRRLLRQIVRTARHCERSDALEASDWYEEGLRVDPCAEDLCVLMTAYHRLGRPAAE